MRAFENDTGSNMPRIAWCPSCKRAMQIKTVDLGVRQRSGTVHFMCTQCGITKRETINRFLDDAS